MNIFKPEKKTPKNQKTRKPRLYKQALCLVSILSLMIVQAGALLLRPVPVLASEGAAAYNVAGYILSLLTSYNTAITNQQVVNSIVTTFGNMDCATASAAQIETGLATIAQTTGFDLAPIFATTAEEAAEVAAIYEGWGETAIAAASAGTNIEAGAKGLALAAAGGAAGTVLPAIGGVVLPAAAAVGLGVAGGILIDHIKNKLINFIKTGKQITTPQQEINLSLNYPNTAQMDKKNGVPQYIVCGDGVLPVSWPYKSNQSYVGFGKYVSGDRIIGLGPSNDLRWITISSNNVDWSQWSNNSNISGFTHFNSKSEAQAYIDGIRNGIIPNPTYNKVSPDIIGNIGNQKGQTENGSYVLPNINPIYNYGNTIIQYINPSDYQDFVNNANNNTNNGDIGEDTQGVDFETFVNPYIQPVTNPEPNPDPNPTSVPQPTQAPIEGVNPVPDPQPTSAPLPTPSPEEEEQLPEGMTNPDWKEKFPFCIPYDLLAFMQIWQEARAAPRFEFDLSFGTNGRYGLGVVVIDLAPFDSAAQLLRLLQLILFIVGLAIGTHKLLNPSGGGGD